MIGQLPTSQQLAETIRFASDLGLSADKDGVRELCRCLGVGGARVHLTAVGAVLDGGLAHGLPPDEAAARRSLSLCAGDVDGAISLLRRQQGRGAPSGSGLARLRECSAELAADLADGTLQKLSSRRGDPEGYLREVVAVKDGAALVGIDLRWRSAAARLADAGSVDAALAEVRWLSHRRSRRLSRLCTLRNPLRGTDVEKSNALARCGCRGCSERLVGQLRPYTARMLRNEQIAETDERLGLAGEALVDALDRWRDDRGTSFAAYYAGVVTKKLAANARQRTELLRALGEPVPLSNDPTELEGDGHRVGLYELVPDRNVDVLAIVIVRDRFRAQARRVRDAVIERLRCYDDGGGQTA